MRHGGLWGRKKIWGFTKLRIPYWGPYCKGILLCGGSILGSLIFVNPHRRGHVPPSDILGPQSPVQEVPLQPKDSRFRYYGALGWGVAY